MSNPAPRIFVSHSHRDDAITMRLVEDTRRAGAHVWVDMTGMDPGNLMQRISQTLDTHEWMVLVLTPAAIASQYVQQARDLGHTSISLASAPGSVTRSSSTGSRYSSIASRMCCSASSLVSPSLMHPGSAGA